MQVRVWDGKNKQLETVAVIDRVRETITNYAKILFDDQNFTSLFKNICANTNPALWTASDAWRIMQSYQLIIRTIHSRGSAYRAALKIPTFVRDAMWIYNNVNEHSHADFPIYHLTAADICLDVAFRKVNEWPSETLQTSISLPQLAHSATQGAIIAKHVEALLAQSDKPMYKLAYAYKQVARCYHDLSRIFAATADFDNALNYASLAIKTYNILPKLGADEIANISAIYHDLSETFHFKTPYHVIFKLLSQFFNGSNVVSFHQLMQINFNFTHQSTRDTLYETIWSECLELIDRYADHPKVPTSPLKEQLQLDYHRTALRQAMLVLNLETLEPGTPTQSPPPDFSRRRNSFFGVSDSCLKAVTNVGDNSSEIYIPDQIYSSDEKQESSDDAEIMPMSGTIR